jgi:hypothetical protein
MRQINRAAPTALSSRNIRRIWALVAKSYADASAARTNELNAAAFERLPDCRERPLPGLHGLAFDHIEGYNGQTAPRRKRTLRPFEEPSRGANLCGCDHVKFYNADQGNFKVAERSCQFKAR